MKTLYPALIASLLFAASAGVAQGQTGSFAAGDAVTTANVADIQDMIRVADGIDAAVDAKDWVAARAYFADEIRVDFTSLVGGEPATIPADALITGWSGNLKPSKTSFHLRGNHRVAFEGADRALMTSHGYAWNRMEAGGLPENGGNPLWEVWGTYEHGFVRTAEGWRVDAMTFTATAQRGNDYVRDTVPVE